MNITLKNFVSIATVALFAVVFALGVFSYASADWSVSGDNGSTGTCCSVDVGAAAYADTYVYTPPIDYAPPSYTPPAPVVIPAPTCTLSINKTSIVKGESVILTWSSTNAQNASLDTVGGVQTYGSRVMTPTQSMTYKLNIKGKNGAMVYCYKSVVVTNPPPPPVCPVGTTGTYPNCHIPTPVCPAGTTGTYPNCVVPTPACPTGTSGNYPNCIVNQVTCPAGMIAGANNICINNVNNNQNNNQNVNNNVVNVNIPGYQYQPTTPTYQNPTCTLTASQTYVNYGQAVTLNWYSNYANSGFINNNVGNVNPSGSRTVYPTQTTTYTGTFYGYNGQTVQCSATVYVQNYVQPPVYQNPVPYVTLSAVPYTGLDLGPVGTIVYWAFLVAWSLFAAYLIAVKRVHMSIYRWYTKTLFGSTEFTTSGAATPVVATSAGALSQSELLSLVQKLAVLVDGPKASTSAITPAANSGVDPFVLSQINRAR